MKVPVYLLRDVLSVQPYNAGDRDVDVLLQGLVQGQGGPGVDFQG